MTGFADPKDPGGIPDGPLDPGGSEGVGEQGGGSGGAVARGPGVDWRARAQEAEAKAAELMASLAETRAALREAEASLGRCERGREVDAALLGAGAIDLETARVLAERALGAGGEGEGSGDVPEVVSALRASKPFLFADASGYGAGGAMGAHVRAEDGTARLEDAAEAALRSGDRVALLRYLRMKRGGGGRE